jgi:hypothetical protein
MYDICKFPCSKTKKSRGNDDLVPEADAGRKSKEERMWTVKNLAVGPALAVKETRLFRGLTHFQYVTEKRKLLMQILGFAVR